MSNSCNTNNRKFWSCRVPLYIYDTYILEARILDDTFCYSISASPHSSGIGNGKQVDSWNDSHAVATTCKFCWITVGCYKLWCLMEQFEKLLSRLLCRLLWIHLLILGPSLTSANCSWETDGSCD